MNTEIKKYIIYIKEHFFEIVDDILCFWANNKLYFLCTAIYFYISFCIFGGNFKSFILLLLIYTVSIIISFSPIGEKLLRLLNNVRPLETSKEKEYILPLFQEVFEQAKIKNKYLNKIEICIIDNMTVNAMALGKRTIAVTKGAINTFTEEQLSDNFQTLMGAINKAKPASLKGQYVKSATLASTMGPGVKINPMKLV